MIKAIIFDLDGVIISTDEFHYLAWKEVFAAFGINLTREDNNQLRGVSRTDCIDIICNLYGLTLKKEEKELVATNKNNLYIIKLAQLNAEHVSSEVKDTMRKIRGMDIKTAIGSSSKNARLILRQIRMEKLFDAIVDGNQVTNTKPHPEVFLRAAKLLSVKPRDCLVVEDSRAGIDAAKDGGFYSIGMGDAMNNKRTDYIAATFSDILKFL